MVFNALQINSYVFSEEIGTKAKKSVWLTRGQHNGICEVRSQRQSLHWPSSGDVWVWVCTFWRPQCPGHSMNVVVHIGKKKAFQTGFPSSDELDQQLSSFLEFPVVSAAACNSAGR